MTDDPARLLLDPGFQKYCRRAAAIMYLLILILGSIPGARAGIGEYAPSAVLHGLSYSVLALLLFLGRPGHAAQRAKTAVLGVMFMGAGDEFVQSFLSYRGASVADWLVDCAAALAAAAVLSVLYPRLMRGRTAQASRTGRLSSARPAPPSADRPDFPAATGRPASGDR